MEWLVFFLLSIVNLTASFAQETDPTISAQQTKSTELKSNALYIGSHILTIDVFYEKIIPNKEKPRRHLHSEEKSIFLKQDLSFPSLVKIFFTQVMHMAGYRYQGTNGFLFRADMAFIHPGISVGYIL